MLFGPPAVFRRGLASTGACPPCRSSIARTGRPDDDSPAGSTRARIEQVFSRDLARLGYEGLSLEAVPREVGIRKPSSYHHFPGGKQTLLAEVTLDDVEAQAPLTRDVPVAGGSPNRAGVTQPSAGCSASQ